MAEENKSAESKMTSRKFLVWLVWLLITVAVFVISFIKDDSKEIINSVIQDFFIISVTYLGVNGIQKVGGYVSDALSGGAYEQNPEGEK